MKRITKCCSCLQIIRLHGSYKAKLETEEEINGMYTGRLLTRVVSLCKDCATKAGYHIKKI